MLTKYPVYCQLTNAAFRKKIETGRKILSRCTLCPHNCRVNRLQRETGFCRSSSEAEISHWQLHFGEEPPLSGQGGAGTVFFTHCNLSCVFCQNYQISQDTAQNKGLAAEELGRIMLELQKQGAQNIDLVSPTHFVPQILEAVYFARNKGLLLPLVYNSNAYENIATLELLAGVVDIYLPDYKYADDENAFNYSKIRNYAHHASRTVERMYKQVGDLLSDKEGRALRGLFVRHLVLPKRLSGSFAVLEDLKRKTNLGIGLSIMSQYAPHYRAGEFNNLSRTLMPQEYNEVVDYAKKSGFEKCWIQELSSSLVYSPDFQKRDVFGQDSCILKNQKARGGSF
ncbi:MAG: radical SAM protein [Candidatus Omnitrophota bacterium]